MEQVQVVAVTNELHYLLVKQNQGLFLVRAVCLIKTQNGGLAGGAM